MHKLFFIAISLLLVNACNSSKYLLYSEGGNEDYLINIIRKANEEGKISKHPKIMVDRAIYKNHYDFRKNKVAKSDILKLEVRDFETTELYYEKYGDLGLIEITTNKSQSFYQENTLYIIEGKPLSKADVENLNPDSIQKIEVIKDKKRISEFTTEDYEGIIIIYLK